MQLSLENVDICSNHEECEARREQIKVTKGFIAKEPLKGHMASFSFYGIPSVSFMNSHNLVNW